MKAFISYFIKYPVAVNIFIIGFLIFGYLGYQRLNSSLFPLSDPSFISISVSYPGASPEEVEEGVIEKIERNLKGVEGVDRITSVSQENLGTVNVEILTDFDINLALDEIKNAVDKIPSFPSNTEPPVIETLKPTREAITFVVTGKDVPLSILKRTAQEVEEDLLRIDGISQIALSGFPEEEIEIAVTEEVLRSYGLTFEEVSRAVANANIFITGGSIKTTKEEYLIRANNKAYYAENLGGIVVKADATGGKVYLRDISKITNTFNETPDKISLNGQAAVKISITNTNTEDLIGSVEKIREYIAVFNKDHNNLRLEITMDTSEVIKDRISLLLENALIGMLLVLLLLSFFLRPGVALWVAFGLPISFFGMFILLPQYGVTLNMLSLFGMILVIGILVDDGIVIAENIYTRYEKGESAIKAAVNGTLDVLIPILSAIATTILAFSVFFFLDGQIGAFFGDIAVVVALTLLVSLIEALLILPAHLAHSKDLSGKGKTYKFNQWGDQFMNYLRDKVYSPSFRFVLRNKFASFSIILFLFILTLGAFAGGIIRLTFFPTTASNQIRITLNTPQGTHENLTDSLAIYVENSVWKVNRDLGKNEIGRDHIVSTVKQIGPGSSASTITVNLSPSETRILGSTEIADAIRKTVGELPQVEKLSFNSGGNVGGMPISVSLQGKDIASINGAKDIIYEELKKNPYVKDIVDTSPEGIKEIRLELKENAQLLGLTLNDIMAQVRSAFFGNEVQRVQRGQDEVKIWVRYDEQDRSSVNNVNDIQIAAQNGRIPLSEIATYTIERGEVAINHLDGIREITVAADLANPKASASEIMQDLTIRVAGIVSEKYPGVKVSAEGQNREVNKISISALNTLPALIFLIYVTIVFAFRSYSQPFILLAIVPFCLIGVAWGHWLHGFPMSILSYLGIIGLIGIVVNDGLVFTGRFNSFLKEGLKFDEALYETGRARFRAIFLTSITTIAGLAPLMLEKSLQAQFLIPMAISIAYGIAVATLLTLYMLPLFLSFSNSAKVFLKYVVTRKRPEREEVERAIKELKVDDVKI
ncbi:efflux RND transporter permease subunit [Ulvibacterium sp.]|uniref:efflux RND transporter permease subunit n=1 Tax=Ulvibacterium sp. TaxID=2665914 RepID=UPI0026348A61|nr:efflux RND transporter permease subunit [Ulvibacterium sp.]